MTKNKKVRNRSRKFRKNNDLKSKNEKQVKKVPEKQ